ncbi:4744_t:CDS:10 [Cetraspora pellucida]|uniref:Spindle pole body component n=1 Tax=Cetraspora pellucida TaxID=1433469 RepID=A0A9N9A0Z7_9GLOM|nr:4744_t:CDS:10 [Cetraspora pellucida]
MSINIVNASIEKLVLNITKKQPETDDYKKDVKYVHSSFKFGKFGSTSQKDVLKKYNGLAEKFRIHAQGTKAEFLEKYVSSLMQRPMVEGSIQPHTRYDILCLLLNLSDSPLSTKYSPIIKVKKPDQPQWIRARLGDRAVNFQNGRNQNLIPETSQNVVQQDGVEETPDQNLNYDIVQELLSNQYWRPNYRNQPLDSKFDANDASTFAPSLAQYRSQDERYLFYDPTRLKYITELDAIREVLFMLSGRPSFLFCKDTNGKFQVQLNAVLMHLTEGGLKALLEYFCEYGNFLVKLRIVATRISTESRPTYGQTAQAFAASILKMVWKFDKSLSDIESKYQINKSVSQDQDTYISLLQLRNHISLHLYEFKIVYDFFEKHLSHDFPNRLFDISDQDQSDVPASTRLYSSCKIAYKILSGLFNEVVHHQISGNKNIFIMLGGHLDNSLVPYIRMIDEWICTGTLNDPEDEFFFVRSQTMKNTSSQYWQEMYKIRETCIMIDNVESVQSLSPPFLEPLIGRILFCGKAQNLLMSLKTRKVDIREYMLSLQHNSKELALDIESLRLFDNKINHKLSVENTSANGIDCKLLEMESLSDFNGIIDAFPKTISSLFPLWQSSTEKEENVKMESKEINNMLIFQPFNERLKERFEGYIQPRYERIGRQLYDTLVEKCRLWKHLRSLAGIYFMQQGESMHLLCDVLFERIDKKQMWYDRYILNDIFLNTVRKWKWLDGGLVSAWIDDVPGKRPDITTVKVFEKIVIEYRIPWPINNIIQSRTLQYYKRIVVFLLQVKRAKYLLERLSFSRLNRDNEMTEKTTAMVSFYGVRIKLIWFLNTIWDYAMRNILLSETEKFYKKLEKVFDVDEMVSLHNYYINAVHDRCLLSDKTIPIHKSILDVLDLAIQFSTLYTHYQGENVSFYDHSRDDKSKKDENASDSDSDTFLTDDDDDINGIEPIIPEQVDHETFLEGLSRIDKEFNRNKEFISNSVQIIARVGGFWWFDALALALG